VRSDLLGPAKTGANMAGLSRRRGKELYVRFYNYTSFYNSITL